MTEGGEPSEWYESSVPSLREEARQPSSIPANAESPLMATGPSI